MIDCDYFIRLVDLPPGIGGVVTPNDDTTFSIYINSRLPFDQQQKALKHEIDHIEYDDFYNDRPIEECEKKRAS